MPIPTAARSKSWVCGHYVAGIAGSNPAGGADICVVCFTMKTKEQARAMQTQKQVRKKLRRQNKRRNSENKIGGGGGEGEEEEESGLEV